MESLKNIITGKELVPKSESSMTKPQTLSPVKISTDFIGYKITPQKKDFELKGDKIIIHYNELATYNEDEYPVTNKDFENIKLAINQGIKLIKLTNGTTIAISDIRKIQPKTKTLEIKPWTSPVDIQEYEELKNG